MTDESNHHELVIIETSSNQSYIFATDKLRENEGASHLVRCAGVDWVSAALGSVVHEVIVQTSGKAIVLVPTGTGRKLVWDVTLKALREAPGLDVCGIVSSKPFDFDPKGFGLAGESKDLHERFGAVRFARPQPVTRFPRLPIVSECASSGLPASGTVRYGDTEFDAAAAVLAKRDARNAGRGAIKDSVIDTRTRAEGSASDEWVVKFAATVDDLAGFGLAGLGGAAERDSAATGDEATSGGGMLAIVHADGNRFGRHFIELGNKPRLSNGDWIAETKGLSAGLEAAVIESFTAATLAVRAAQEGVAGLRNAIAADTVPIIPLVVAADDLTVLVAAPYARIFTETFLREFRGAASKVRADATACAGIVYAKTHFPFSTAYDIVEELIGEAKRPIRRTVEPATLYDVHVIGDSVTTSLDALRGPSGSLWSRNSTQLWGGPYLVKDASPTPALHDVSKLDPLATSEALGVVSRALAEQLGTDATGRGASSAAIHRIRAALGSGRQPDADEVPEPLRALRPRNGTEVTHEVFLKVFLDALRLAVIEREVR